MNFAIVDLTASQKYELIKLSETKYAIFDTSTEYNQPMVAKADNAELAEVLLSFLAKLPAGTKFPRMHDWHAL